MDRFATKTRGEREDEEVERLVRPSPKVKPPRHDRRRETVETDQDPDLDNGDKDLSRNFKDIGGSTGSMVLRVLRKWAKDAPESDPSDPASWLKERKKKTNAKPAEKKPPAGAFSSQKPAAPSAAQSKPAAKPAAPGGGKEVRVKDKAKGWVGEVSQETLKENPGKYEVVKSTEPPSAAPAGAAKPKKTIKDLKLKPVLHKQKTEAPAPTEAPKGEAPKAEAPKAEAPKAEAPKAEAPKAEAPKAEAPKAEAPEAPKAEAPKSQAEEAPKAPKTKAKAPKGEAAKDESKGEEAPKKPDKAPAEALESQIANAWVDAGFTDSADNPVGKVFQNLKKKIPLQPDDVKNALRTVRDVAADPSLSEDKVKGLKTLTKALKSYGAQLATPAAPAAPAAAGAPAAPAAAPAATPAAPGTPAAPAGGAAPKGQNAPGAAKPPKGQPAPDTRQYGPGQPNRPVTKSERMESDRRVVETFPEALAGKILTAVPPYHPDEVAAMVRDFNLAKHVPVKDPAELIKQVGSFYATDPTKVPRPAQVEDEHGKMVDLDKLPAEDQAKALRRHQVKTVAMSLAAKQAVTDSVVHHGAPRDLADSLSDFMLSGDTDKSKRADDAAKKLFVRGLGKKDKQPPLSDHKVKQLLHSTSHDPDLQKLVVSYCQAQDYQGARRKFLDPKSSHHLSEKQSPKEIARNLAKASQFLRDRSKRYPEGTGLEETQAVFRRRVMDKLTGLAPDKATKVQSMLDQHDNKQYDHDLKRFKKHEKAHGKQVKKTQKEYKSDYDKYSEALRKGKLKPNADPPLSVLERLDKAGHKAPVAPTKPVNYDKHKNDPEQAGRVSKKFWDKWTKSFRKKHASGSGYSIYPGTHAMDRQAVYWGVEPYPMGHEGFEPYGDSLQPRARDLGDQEFTHILKVAREWLKTSMLSKNIDGVVKDTQLRAALDLALRTENYDHALHPALYNRLLARLAGVSENETLLTVRSKTARNQMLSKNVQLQTAQADQFLARLDRIASVVQANHGKWGMDFQAAKNLVNAIDKVADDLERATYGEESLLRRQASEIGHEKLAEVLERDSDESYMETFKNPMQPHQTEANEPYMSAYGDDQSSGVNHGKASNGRPLAP